MLNSNVNTTAQKHDELYDMERYGYHKYSSTRNIIKLTDRTFH